MADSPADNAILKELQKIEKLMTQVLGGRTGGGSGGGGGRTGGGTGGGSGSYPPNASGRERASEQPERHKGSYTSGQNVTNAGELASGAGKQLDKAASWAQNKGFGTTASALGGAASRASSAGAFFQTAGESYVPKAAGAASAINSGIIQPARKIGAMSTDLNQLGESMGLSAAGGDISIGGIGGRTPFNQAALEGAKIKASMLVDSAQAGVTKAQAKGIYGELMGRGIMPGTQGFGGMKNAMLDINKYNSLLGQDPRTSEMLDKATRMGGASLKDFLSTMKEVPTAMKAGRESMGQVLDDMKAFGDLSKQQGGTYQGGMHTATSMTAASGMPGQTLLQMQQNGFVQARQMQQTGLMPWQLGQMSPQQRLMSTMQTVQGLSRQLGPGGPDKTTKDQYGFSVTERGSVKQDATIGMMLGIDQATATKMRENAGTIMAGTKIQSGMQHYQDAASTILHSNMSDDQKKMKLQQLQGSGAMQNVMGAMRAKGSGFTSKDIESVTKAGAGSGGTAAEMAHRATNRLDKFNEILGKKREGMQFGKDSGPQVLVGLTPEAKKYLHIKGSDKTKADANAGNGSTVSISVPPTGFTE